jgi:hypothetical protein
METSTNEKIKITAMMVMRDVFTTDEIKSMVNDEQRTFTTKRTSPKGTDYNMMVAKVGKDDYAVWAKKSEITGRTRANFLYSNGQWICPSKNHHIEILD